MMLRIVSRGIAFTVSWRRARWTRRWPRFPRGRADLEEVGRVERRATDQPAVHIRLRKQLEGVAGLHAAAVEEPQRARDSSIARRDFATQEAVRLPRLPRARGPPGADRPDRLVGDDHALERSDPRPVEQRIELAAEHRLGAPGVALLERLADARDR